MSRRRRLANIAAFGILLVGCAGCAARKVPEIPSFDPAVEARPPALAAEQQALSTCDPYFIERVFQNVRRAEDNLGKYEFDITHAHFDLSGASPGRLKWSRTAHVSYIGEQPVVEWIAQDGQPLSRKDQEKQDKRVQDQLKKFKDLDTPLFVRATMLVTISSRPWLPPLSFLLGKYEVLSCHETRDATGRDLVVLELRRVADAYDAFTLPLPARGGVSVLTDEEQVIEASVVGNEKFLGGILGGLNEWGLRYQFTKVGNDWVPARVDEQMIGRAAWLHPRFRVSYIFDHFRPVEAPPDPQASPVTQ